VQEVYDDLPGESRVTLFRKKVFTLGDIMRKGWFIRTGSMFFRSNVLPDRMPAWVYDFPYRLDSILPVLLCMHGLASYSDEVMSVWRKHSKGMSYQLHEDGIHNSMTKLKLTQKLNELTGLKFEKESSQLSARIYTNLFISILRSDRKLKYQQLFFKSISKMDYCFLFLMLKNRLVGGQKA
jgi:hypothetical protein